MSDWNKQVIEEFRANGGRVAQFGDAPLVILHTVGARSGETREIPLVALIDADGMFVFASRAGSTQHPDWLFNLRAQPDITVEFGTETFRARVTELPDPQRAEKLDAQAAIMPVFAGYVTSAAPRQIPVLAIERL
jgi:deazaflavin-dependent oxidoreductase (nitroreductase family)